MKTTIVISLLLFCSTVAAGPTAIQVEMTTVHSPGISSFYKGVINDLAYNKSSYADSDDNETLLYKNTSTFTNFSVSFSLHEFQNERVIFTPLMTNTLGYKRLKYQTWDSYSYFTVPSFEHMRNFRMFTGLTPEMRVPLTEDSSSMSSVVIAPLVQVGGTLMTGTFGTDFLFTIRTGVSLKWEKLWGNECRKRGISIGGSLYFEKLPSGDREYGMTYESAEWRIPDEPRYQIYPGESVSFGLTVGYSLRRNNAK